MKKSILVGIVMLFLCESAYSATITFNLNMDLNDGTLGEGNYSNGIPIPLLTIYQGDIIDTTVNFTGGGRVKITEMFDGNQAITLSFLRVPPSGGGLQTRTQEAVLNCWD